MRCANSFPRLVYFMRADDTLPVWKMCTGDTLCTWNTERAQMAEKQTTPLPVWNLRHALMQEGWQFADEEEEKEDVSWLL